MSLQNYNYFKVNHEELQKKYSGKYVAIKNEAIIGAYDDFDEAFDQTSATEELGTFIIQRCVNDSDNVVTFVSSNVVFV